jgi:BirA family biotin operon repressor/biotin-[acetyl-CoA-carboxylase] ligase
MITAYAAVCVCRAIEELAPVKAQIKWVNDVYLNGKKTAGILTEGEFLPASCEFSYVAVGIGVNLYSLPFPTELSAIATDVESQSGVKIHPCDLIYKIIMMLRNFESERDSFIEEYRRRSTLIGKTVTVELLSGSYSATVLGIDDEARLIIETTDGITHLATGEVSVRAAEE